MDDSAVVDDMFGFLENQNDNMSESQAPSAFRYKIDLYPGMFCFCLSSSNFRYNVYPKMIANKFCIFSCLAVLLRSENPHFFISIFV